jgi:hypothetical protein
MTKQWPSPARTATIKPTGITRRAAIGAGTAALCMPAVLAGGTAVPRPAAGDIVIGRRDAPGAFAYLSPGCPHTLSFIRDVLPVLLRGAIEQGRMHLVWREVYLYPRDVMAAAAMRSAGVESFLTLATRILAVQPHWRDGADPADVLRSAAGEADVAIMSALRNSGFMRNLLADFRRTGGAHGICASPTFLTPTWRHVGLLDADALTTLTVGHPVVDRFA